MKPVDFGDNRFGASVSQFSPHRCDFCPEFQAFGRCNLVKLPGKSSALLTGRSFPLAVASLQLAKLATTLLFPDWI